MAKSLLKSIAAIFIGFFTVAILSIATDTILEKLGIFPPIADGLFITWMLVLALVYRSVYAVVGGYVTARFAPEDPMKHVWILAGIGMIMSVIGIFVGWDLSQHWYPIMLAVTTIPCVWLGGKLRVG